MSLKYEPAWAGFVDQSQLRTVVGHFLERLEVVDDRFAVGRHFQLAVNVCRASEIVAEGGVGFPVAGVDRGVRRTLQREGELRAVAGAAIVLISRLLSLPRTPWESDEFLFIQAVRQFDPLRHHPHPPGRPG